MTEVLSQRLEGTLRRYDEDLLRVVAGRLLRPRNQWPVEELIERGLSTLSEVTIIDRRLKELGPAERQLVAAIGRSRQSVWAVGNLVELAMSLGQTDGLAIVFELLHAGFLYPVLRLEEKSKGRVPALKSFEQWLAFAEPGGLQVFAHPLAMTRALVEPLPFADAPAAVAVVGSPLEADGLDWPMRLAVLWQQVASAPLRRTQQGDFFKRDFDRLLADPLLNAPSPEGLPLVPHPAFLAVELGKEVGLFTEADGELKAAAFPPEWQEGLAPTLAGLYRALPRLRAWEPLEGCRDPNQPGTPFPSASLLALLLVAQNGDGWTTPQSVLEGVLRRHPYWQPQDEVRPSRLRDWMTPFLLGLCYQLRIVQAARTVEGEWAVRLSPMGRWLLGLDNTPPPEMTFPRTLLVQPNLEIVAYRQGLTPALIDFLAHTAAFQSLGSVCTLQLGPESVYRGLESGLRYESILQTLERHGTRPTPPAVLDLLRTWSNKRDRITVYPSAALLEFGSKEDLDAALARGFPGVRLSDCLAVVASEANIDYTLFRLTASRDYASRPEQCVAVEDDGVTLTVDLTRSDLLLESELSRFAEPAEKPGTNGRRRYLLTPTSMTQARQGGLSVDDLETWFRQRAGEAASPASLLLLTGGQEQPLTLRTHIVLHVADEVLADGLMQWPQTRSLIAERLGPTALSVPVSRVNDLRDQLRQVGVSVEEPTS